MDTIQPEGLSQTQQASALTARQLQVISLVVSGFSNKDLAQALGITEHTAKNHLTNIYGKLGAANRLELVLVAIHQRLIS
jgi:two-component system, NarL family, nitrate/nitrite response regulator NarL